MKPALIVNENFPAPALRVLRAQGLDVLSVQETMPGATDEAVLATACETGRWLVTFDRGYGELVFSRQCAPPPVILYLRRSPCRQHPPPNGCWSCWPSPRLPSGISLLSASELFDAGHCPRYHFE